jgi:hypothetical protein
MTNPELYILWKEVVVAYLKTLFWHGLGSTGKNQGKLLRIVDFTTKIRNGHFRDTPGKGYYLSKLVRTNLMQDRIIWGLGSGACQYINVM